MSDQNNQNLNVMGRLLACETIIMGLLLKNRDHQQICAQAVKVVELYESEARKTIKPGDNAENVAFALKIFSEAKANIAAMASSIR